MKTILCYGDSNTWGFKSRLSPTKVERYKKSERWTGILGRVLGRGYSIIEEGNIGRTTVWDDPLLPYKNGRDTLIPCLDTHQPLDLVIIALGTNDLKGRFNKSAIEIAAGAGDLVWIVQRWVPLVGDTPKVVLVAPPPLANLIGDAAAIFSGGQQKSRFLAKCYQAVAEERGCEFVDTGEASLSLSGDGVHFTRQDHRIFGEYLAKKVANLQEKD